MAVRIDAASDYLRRTTDLPNSDPLTVCFWFYISVDRNALGFFWVLSNNAGSTYDGISFGADGTTIQLSTNAGSTAGTNCSTGTWYHVARVRDGSSHTLYLNGVSDATRTDSNAVTEEVMAFGSNTVNNFNNGRHAAFKLWTAALTQEEVQAEMWSYTPKRFANLHMWSPLCENDTTNFVDFSGNGRNWTEGGTVTIEDGPPISWGGRNSGRIFITPPAAAAFLSRLALMGVG